MGTATNPNPVDDAAAILDSLFSTRMDRLRLRHLRLFEMTARAGSLSAAAQRIGMSQPAATKMLQELEQAFGCKLIERSAKGGQLNTSGLHLLARMRIALGSLGTARAAIESKNEVPLVRMGLLPLVGIDALPGVVRAMEADRTLARLQLQTGSVNTLLKALADGRVDCVVGGLGDTALPDMVDRFHVTPLWQDTLVVAAAADHPLARRDLVPLELARSCEWILMQPGSANRHAVESMFRQAGLVPPVARIETDSFHISLSLAASSQLLTVVPDSAYRQYRPRVQALRLPRAFPARALVFVTLAGVPCLPAVEALSQRFQQYARNLDPDAGSDR